MSDNLPSGRDGRFRAIGVDSGTGRPLEVALMPGGGHASRRVIPEQAVDTFLAENARLRERFPRGYLLGDTQRHKVPLVRIPRPIAQQLERRFGPYRENRKRWLAAIASEYPHFFASGYRS